MKLWRETGKKSEILCGLAGGAAEGVKLQGIWRRGGQAEGGSGGRGGPGVLEGGGGRRKKGLKGVHPETAQNNVFFLEKCQRKS